MSSTFCFGFDRCLNRCATTVVLARPRPGGVIEFVSEFQIPDTWLMDGPPRPAGNARQRRKARRAQRRS